MRMLLVQWHLCINYCLHMWHLLCAYLALCQLFYQRYLSSSLKYPLQTGFTSPLSRWGNLDVLSWNVINSPHLWRSERSVLHSSFPSLTVHLCRPEIKREFPAAIMNVRQLWSPGGQGADVESNFCEDWEEVIEMIWQWRDTSLCNPDSWCKELLATGPSVLEAVDQCWKPGTCTVWKRIKLLQLGSF